MSLINFKLAVLVSFIGFFNGVEAQMLEANQVKKELNSKIDYINRFPEPDRLVVIGDVHGDGYALIQILRSMKLVDHKLNWIAGKTMVVIVGDVLDRGLSSRLAMDTIIDVTSKAKLQGGLVITLMGNHEFLVGTGDLRYFSKRDVPNYADFAKSNKDSYKKIILNAFAPNSKYGQWLESLPVAVIVGQTLFLHAGIESWISKVSVEDINRLARAWFKYYRRQGPKPPQSSGWVIGDRGPFWTRKAAIGEIPLHRIQQYLQSANVDQVVVGHTITEDNLPHLNHPVLGSHFVMIDTAISSAFDGHISAIQKLKGQPSFRSFVFEREPHPEGLTPLDLVFLNSDGIDYVPPEIQIEEFIVTPGSSGVRPQQPPRPQRPHRQGGMPTRNY